ILFHESLLGGLENFLPGQIQTVPVVSNVHYVLLDKFFPDARVDKLEYSTAVCDRCFAALRRRLHAEKEKLHGPVMSVRVLVVKRYVMVRRILRRGVYPVTHFCSLDRALEVIQQLRRNRFHHLLEFSYRLDVEAPEKDRAVF